MPYLATIQRYAAFAAIALMLLLLIGANSAASIIIALALGIFAPTVVWARSKYAGRPRFLVVVALCSLAIIAVLSTVGEEAVLDAVGKDATFTGRTDVWQFSVDAIRERPLLGYGYKVFWLNNGAADPTGRTTTWATGAHNGLIDIGLDLGLTGILVAIIFVAVAIRNSLRFFWTGRDLPTSWPLFVFFSFVLTNVTEGKIASYYDVSWVVVVAAFYYTAEPTERCTP
jgi:O-antigen ligase